MKFTDFRARISAILLLLVIGCSESISKKHRNENLHSDGLQADALSKELTPESVASATLPLIGQQQMFFLTKEQLYRTLKGVFPGAVEKSDFNYDESSFKLAKENERASIHTMGSFSDLWKAYNTITDRIVNDSSAGSLLQNCNTQNLEDPCLIEVINSVGKKLFRRSLTKDEQSRYKDLIVSEGADNIQLGIKYSLMAMLSSPAFLYQKFYGDGSGKLTSQEYASRIAFFILQANPDEALIDAAEKGNLFEKNQAIQQAERLLSDTNTKSEIFSDFFMQSWKLNLLDESSTAQLFPEDLSKLRPHFEQEFKKVAEEIVSNHNSDWRQALMGKFTILNKALSEHYGIDSGSSSNSDWKLVDVSSENRSGLLTTGLNFAMHSAGKYSSSVHRGLFVLSDLLCESAGGAPPNVDELIENSGVSFSDSDTVHERIQKRAETPVCGACHQHFDPLGMIMENFDNLGVFHTERFDAPVVSKTTIDSKEMSSITELGEHLASTDKTAMCIYNNLFSFATGYQVGSNVGDLSSGENQQPTDSFSINELIKHIIINPTFYKLNSNEGG